MHNAVKIVLFIIALVLAYLVFDSIAGEMRDREEVKQVEALVIDKLENIRLAQLTYKDKKGQFANNFDTLIDYINNGKLMIVKQFGDKDDSTSVYREEFIFVPILDTLFKGFNVDSMAFVPPDDTAKFVMDATIITQGNVEVPVFQVVDPHPRDKQRLNKDHPKKALQVGSLIEATYSGNWK